MIKHIRDFDLCPSPLCATKHDCLNEKDGCACLLDKLWFDGEEYSHRALSAALAESDPFPEHHLPTIPLDVRAAVVFTVMVCLIAEFWSRVDWLKVLMRIFFGASAVAFVIFIYAIYRLIF